MIRNFQSIWYCIMRFFRMFISVHLFRHLEPGFCQPSWFIQLFGIVLHFWLIN
jgi:hypothetical protein